jgi:hypothetical protein
MHSVFNTTHPPRDFNPTLADAQVRLKPLEMQNPITFVTAYFEIYPPNSNNKSKEMRFENFAKLANTNIPIVIFTDKESLPAFDSFKDECNLHFIVLPFKDLETYKETFMTGVKTLPDKRCPKKDTLEFMILMNAKAEFMKLAIEANPWNSTHYCWIDFSILYVFKQVEESIQYLKTFSTKQLQPSFFAIPGCWDIGVFKHLLWNSINWRYCGGFFVADKQSLLDFYTLYREIYKKILFLAGRMTWETNIWHILELEYGWKPNWFKADHNDSICHLPQQFFLQNV